MVVVIRPGEPTAYWLLDGTAYTGDPTALADCGGAVVECGVTATNGQTGTASGVFTDACTVLTMPASGNPETSFPAAGYPVWWRQAFTGGVTGAETWIVQVDTTGANQWHQIA